MGVLDSYYNSPLGSLAVQPQEKESAYLDAIGKLPKNLFQIASSPMTGSFLKGLGKSFDLAPEVVSKISFEVLRVLVGELTLATLGGVLSGQLKLPNDKAQGIAQEIEKELFTPIMLELNDFLAKQKQAASAGASASRAGAQNVVDLKQPTKVQKGSSALPKPGQFNA